MEQQEQAAHEPMNLSTEGHSELSSLVDRWIVAFNTHDARQIVSLYHEDAELFDSGMRYPRKGREAIRAWFTQRFEQMPSIEYVRMKSFLQAEEGVVTWIARGSTPALLGQRWLVRPYEVEGVSQFIMRDGRIYWQHGFYDHLSIVEKVLPFLKWLPIKL
jgi:uncharacterized protein (TIGR02246 family)